MAFDASDLQDAQKWGYLSGLQAAQEAARYGMLEIAADVCEELLSHGMARSPEFWTIVMALPAKVVDSGFKPHSTRPGMDRFEYRAALLAVIEEWIDVEAVR